MMKEKYERTKLDIMKFEAEDVISTSGVNPDDDYELERSNIRIPLI